MAHKIDIDLLQNDFIQEAIVKTLEAGGIDYTIKEATLTFDDENFSLFLLKYGSVDKFYDYFLDVTIPKVYIKHNDLP